MFFFFLPVDFQRYFRIHLKMLFLLNFLVLHQHLIFSSIRNLLHKLISIVIFPIHLSFDHFLLHNYSPLFLIFNIFVDKAIFEIITFGKHTDKLFLFIVLVTHQHVVVLNSEVDTFLYDIYFMRSASLLC